MPKMALVAALFSICLGLPGADTNPYLKLTSVIKDGKLRISAENISSKPIVAYVVAFEDGGKSATSHGVYSGHVYDPPTPELGIQALGRVTLFDASSNQHYNGLQTRLDKRYSKGLSMGVSYTYSKANGDGEDGGNESAFRQVPNDRAGSRGRTLFDMTHNAVINAVWELPFGRSLHGVPAVFVKGWQVNGIVSLRTGFPFTPTVGGNDLNTGGDGSPIRPDRLQDGRLSDPSRQLWFDPTAFERVSCNIPSRPDLCHFGSAGRNILTSPGQRNLDGSIAKNFAITERVKAQFRGEFFNAFNTPYFGQPVNLGFVSTSSVVPDAPRVGSITSLRGAMRIVQFGLKVSF